MYKEHKVFTPPSSDAILWRYMDFTKFVSLLEKQALFFARADKLGDPFEGSLTKVNEAVLNEAVRSMSYKDQFSEKLLRTITQVSTQATKNLTRWTLINCWHENAHESEAMWRLYARETDGIAIKTDFDSLKNSFTCREDIYIGSVNYVDYDSHFIPEGYTFYRFLHKRKSFEHEREIRAIVTEFPSNDQGFDFSRDICDIGKYYEIDLPVLIQEVVVAPFAPDWFLELVKLVTVRYNFEFPVEKSALADNPTWG